MKNTEPTKKEPTVDERLLEMIARGASLTEMALELQTTKRNIQVRISRLRTVFGIDIPRFKSVDALTKKDIQTTAINLGFKVRSSLVK